jgi:hypothetical protein
VLFNITGGKNMTMHEIDEAAKTITDAVDPDANIIFGAVLDEIMDDDLQITVVATGFDANRRPVRETREQPVPVKTAPEPEPVQVAATEPEPEPEPEPYLPPVMPAPRQPFINERPQAEPEPEVVPIQIPHQEPAPPRRFVPLASIEPADNEEEEATAEPVYEATVETTRVTISESEPLMPLDDDDLDVPAFIRRKVE